MGEGEGLFYVLIFVAMIVYFIVTTEEQREQYLLYSWIALALMCFAPVAQWLLK